MEFWIVRFTLADQIDQPILVRISQKAGGHLLDLDLLATDGDNAYRGKSEFLITGLEHVLQKLTIKVRHNKLQKYKSSSYDGSDQEWLNTLQHVLLLKSDADLPTGVRNNLECVCNVGAGEKKSSLSIILRTRVEDITHTLGTIDLKYSDITDDIDLFAWTNHVVQSCDVLSAVVKQNEQAIRKGSEIIKMLEKQVQDLCQAKEEHETQLLSKFTLLLNEKKFRIRAQQRQLVEQGQPAQWKDAENRPASRRKRKGTELAADNENNSEESDGFQAMDIDPSAGTASDTDPAETSSTASGLKDDSDNLSGPIRQNKEPPRLASATPPPRNLPFAVPSKLSRQEQSQIKVDSAKIQYQDTKQNEDETTSDDDDEL